MKTVITSEAISKGGRSGSIESTGHGESVGGVMPSERASVSFELGNPLEKGLETRGPNPEMLFASAYSACYHGALLNAAKKLGVKLENSKVRAVVYLREDDSGGYNLAVELHGHLPGVKQADGQRVMEAAHKTCPYSKALRGEAPVKLFPHES